MNKELLNKIFTGFGLVIFLLLFISIGYNWTQGKQPDNFTVLIVLLVYISIDSRMSKKL